MTKLCRWRHLRTLRPMEREAKAEAAPARRLGAAPARAAVGGEEEEAAAAAPRQDLYGLFSFSRGPGETKRRERRHRDAVRGIARQGGPTERRLWHETVLFF